jgi:hypothetical protein
VITCRGLRSTEFDGPDLLGGLAALPPDVRSALLVGAAGLLLAGQAKLPRGSPYRRDAGVGAGSKLADAEKAELVAFPRML